VECRIHLVGLYSNRILSAKAGLHVVIEDHLQQNDSRLHWSVGEIRRGNLCRPEDSGREHMAKSYPIVDHTYDVIVVGAGGAGLRATVGMAAKGPAASKPPA
jgi:hypothetical protein